MKFTCKFLNILQALNVNIKMCILPQMQQLLSPFNLFLMLRKSSLTQENKERVHTRNLKRADIF